MTATSPIEAAAEWWAEQLLGPVHWDNGDSSDQGAMTMILGTLLAGEHPATTEQAEKFKAALVEQLDRHGAATALAWYSLSVDYGPCTELRAAAEVAGIHSSRFPIKTSMSITEAYVTAGLGYRAPMRLIWNKPDWERPACGAANGREANGSDPEGVYWIYLPGACGKPLFHEGDGDMGHGLWQPAALCVCGDPKGAGTGRCWSKELGEHRYQPTGPELP